MQKYCNDCVWFFLPAMLFSRLSCWCSLWLCQKTFWHVPPVFRIWYMIDNKLHHVQLCLFCIPCGTILGWIGNCLWDVLWNKGQYFDGVPVHCSDLPPVYTQIYSTGYKFIRYGPRFFKWSVSLRVFHQIPFAPLLSRICVCAPSVSFFMISSNK